jgi:hypothetical protein
MTMTASTINQQLYAVSDSALLVQLPSFIQNPIDCTETVTYTTALDNGNALPSYIVFDSINQIYTIYTSDTTVQSNYLTIKVLGQTYG